MTLTQILQKIKSAFYTKTETDSKLNAKANSSDLNNYLPLSGGRMTGEVIARTVDDSLLQLRGASNYDRGAYLSVSGEGHSRPGEFYIVARTQTESSKMIGKPNGSLTWNDKNIDTIEEQGDGYIRYSNGLQICWGTVNLNNVNNGELFKDTYFAFPKSFISDPVVSNALNTNGYGWADFTLAVQIFTTHMIIEQYTNRGIATLEAAGNTVTYTAIGRWK